MHRRPLPQHPCDPNGRTFNSDRELADFKIRQHLRENSLEIRELEGKLRQAYINKELALQKQQKETLELQKKQEKAVEAQLSEALRLQVIREEEEAEKRAMLEKIKFRMKLDGQMEEKQSKLNEAYLEFLKEKEVIDAITAEVRAEERKKTIEMMVKKQVTQEEIQEFIESQKVFVIREQERVARENEQIKAFIAKKDAWTEAHEKILKEKRIVKSEAVQKLGEELEAQRVNQRHIEGLIHELNEGRQRELEKLAERQELEREIRKRLTFRQSNEVAMAYRDQVRAREKKEDEIWKARITAEAEKAAKLDQMSDQKRRMKVQELRRDAERLLAEKQRKREIEKTEDKLFWMEFKEAERIRDCMIEAERRRILQEHAHKLIGFFPNGALSEEDLENLGLLNAEFLYKNRQDIAYPFTKVEQKYGNNY